MKTRPTTNKYDLFLTLCTLLNTLFGIYLLGIALQEKTNPAARNMAVVAVPVVFALMWGGTVIQLRFPSVRERLSGPIKRLRQSPILFWLLLLAYFTAGLLVWILKFQPAYDKVGPFEQFYILTWLWIFVFLLGFNLDRPQFDSSIAKLGRSRWAGAMISLTMILVILFSIEIAMRMFLVMSDSGGGTLPSMRWFELYWKPINLLGYRDYELDTDSDESVQRVLVVGDSFAAGHGIKQIDDTFPHILGRELGEGFTVNIVAQRGWNTVSEMDNLEVYPLDPDIVILSYMLNDIENAAFQHGVKPPTLIALPGYALWLAQNFYTANYIWAIANSRWTQGYSESLLAAFSNADTWRDHEAQLQQFIDWTVAHDSQLVVLIWPFLDSPDISEAATRQVEQFFIEQGVPVVNMLDVIPQKPESGLTASPMDRHPSVYTHTLAADALYELLSKQNEVSSGDSG